MKTVFIVCWVIQGAFFPEYFFVGESKCGTYINLDAALSKVAALRQNERANVNLYKGEELEYEYSESTSTATKTEIVTTGNARLAHPGGGSR